MSDWHEMKKDPRHAAREREKAKKMRKSRWWKEEIAKGICHYCKKTFPPEELTMDHIVPVSRGGKSTKGNIVPCCQPCNADKKYLTPVDMILKKLAAEKAARENQESEAEKNASDS